MSRFRNWKTKWKTINIASKLQGHLIFTFQVQNFSKSRLFQIKIQDINASKSFLIQNLNQQAFTDFFGYHCLFHSPFFRWVTTIKFLVVLAFSVSIWMSLSKPTLFESTYAIWPGTKMHEYRLSDKNSGNFMK